MSSNEIRRLGTAINAVVVHLPERKFPGVVIQGDSLRNLLVLMSDTTAALAASDFAESRDLVDEMQGIVAGYVRAYEAAMEKAGLPLPYPKTEQ